MALDQRPRLGDRQDRPRDILRTSPCSIATRAAKRIQRSGSAKKRQQLRDGNRRGRLLHQALAGMAADERIVVGQGPLERVPSRPRRPLTQETDRPGTDGRLGCRPASCDQKLIARRGAKLGEQIERTDSDRRPAIDVSPTLRQVRGPRSDPAALESP